MKSSFDVLGRFFRRSELVERGYTELSAALSGAKILYLSIPKGAKAIDILRGGIYNV